MQSVSRIAKTLRPLSVARNSPVRHFSPPAATGPFIANPKTVSVIGIPLSLGQPLVGVDQGPNALRNAGLVHRITDLGYRVKNVGDLNLQTIISNANGLNDHALAKHSNAVGKANSLSANAVFAEAEQGRFVLALGGDHSMAIGSISGILKQRPNTGVIWVDAHADINTPESSFSKNIHGMAVSFLMKLHDPTVINGFEWMKDYPALGTDQIVYLGLRDVDAPERSILKKHGIKAFSMHEIDKYGIGKVMEMALDHLNAKTQRPLHLSVDIDSCDPFLAPSTGTKVRGGLTFREANFICEAIAETKALGSMDMVEVNPMINDSPSPVKDETVSTALDMIASALGSSILGFE